MNSADLRIAFFDALAKDWDDEDPSSQTMTARLGRHRDKLALAPGQNLLEVGCGTGKTTGWLGRQVAPGRVTAVDFSSGMIARCRAKGIDAEFLCRDVCNGDLGENRYDVVFCFHSFPHFRDQVAALGNLARALKPARRLIVMHLVGSDHINRFHAGIEGPVKGDVLPQGDAWVPLLNDAGLTKVDLIDREDLFFLEAVRKSR